MSSSQQLASATNAVQNGLSGIDIERAKPGASGAINTSQAHKDRALESYDGLTSSGKDKLESVQQQVSLAANDLRTQVSARVDGAAAQGQRDVEETKAAGATYLNQAKAVAGNALGTAQDVLHQGAATVAPADNSAPGIITTLQVATSNALEATGGYLASAQAALTSSVPQETKQGVDKTPDNAKDGATEAAMAEVGTAESALYEPSQAASTAQPHVDAARQADARDTDANPPASGYTTAASKTVQEARETGAALAKPVRQEGQQPDQVKGALDLPQGPVTPVGLPAEGIEGVLKYGEDKSGSTKQVEQPGEYPKAKAY